ncbi:hypothetical protein BHM03_00059367 [Ensete ventricosum]|nr:hypothetical protein BHM03_00059367 [Ensete ventricosum]
MKRQKRTYQDRNCYHRGERKRNVRFGTERKKPKSEPGKQRGEEQLGTPFRGLSLDLCFLLPSLNRDGFHRVE